MSDVDALEAAHARIRELEATRVLRSSAPVRPRMPVWRVGAVFGTCLALLGIALFEIATLGPRSEIVHVPAEAPPPARPDLRGALVHAPAAFYRHQGPSLVDVDGDGERELVVLGWRRARPSEPISVVALDRKTFAPRWDAGPFPGRWRDQNLALDFETAGRVVFYDGHGEAHTIDAVTGRVIGAPIAFATLDRPHLVDRCPIDRSSPCTGTVTDAERRALPRRFLDPYTVVDVFSSDRHDRITIVTPVLMSAVVAVGWTDADTPKVAWAEPLVALPHREEPDPTPNAWTTIESGRVLHLYEEKNGGFRLGARAIATGAEIYDVAIDGLPHGSAVDGLSADGGDLFVAANDAIFVIDAANGAVTKRIERF